MSQNLSSIEKDIQDLEKSIKITTVVDLEQIKEWIRQYNALLVHSNAKELEKIFNLIQDNSQGLLNEDNKIMLNEDGTLSIQETINEDEDELLVSRLRNMKQNHQKSASPTHSKGMKASMPPDAPPIDIKKPFVIHANFDGQKGEIVLNEQQFKDLQLTGLKLEVPGTSSGVIYDFKIDENHNPNASLEILPDDPSDLALTVMNIIENIVSHSAFLVIDTENPVAAGIANAYVEKLQAEGLDIHYEPIIPCAQLTPDIERQLNNVLIDVKDKSWFIAAEENIDNNRLTSNPTNTR